MTTAARMILPAEWLSSVQDTVAKYAATSFWIHHSWCAISCAALGEGEVDAAEHEGIAVCVLHLEKREQQETFKGVWIFEIGELAGLHKSEVTKVKQFVSRDG